MALPDNCEVVNTTLIFRELAFPATLANSEGLYEYVCFTACTNGLRPMGIQTVVEHPFPELGAGELAAWGGRTMTAQDVESFRREGMVLAEIRLPVGPMVGGAPPAAIARLLGDQNADGTGDA